MKRLLSAAIFLAGLAAIAWVAAGYVGVNLPALAVTALIAAFYLAGALELRRHQQATDSLVRALASDPAPPAAPDSAAQTWLQGWLDTLHPSLRHAVRLRVQGERVGLPAPALAPYLAGLLVLLGMLGTFAGMVVTLRGTGLALESAADLPAIRASLAAPVKGLGVAFGTSLAGIATSAMLGLLVALARRARQQAGQLLDAQVATRLRSFSPAHQREQSLQLLERQADAMPLLAERLQQTMAALEQHSQALHERLAIGQERFHAHTEHAYANLASSIDRTLRDNLAESGRLAMATIQPVAEAVLAGVAREATALQQGVARGVQQQLDGIARHLGASTEATARRWDEALAAQTHSHATLSAAWDRSLEGFSAGFAQRSAELVDSLSDWLAMSTERQTRDWREALDQHAAGTQSLTADTQRALVQTATAFEQQAATLLHGVGQAHAELQAQAAARDAQQHTAWTEAAARHERASLAFSSESQQALAATARGFEQHAAALLQGVQQGHEALQTTLASRDAQRLASWTEALSGSAASLHGAWQQAGEQADARQRAICDTLLDTARGIHAQAETQARATIAEIQRLLQAAAEAPRAAAEVIGELRTRLADSLAHDNTLLEERTRLMETLRTLLDAVNHASAEQRSAIDALVGGSAALLERVGSRFAEQAEAGAGRLDGVAAQVSASAVEVASLGEAFGHAVQLFSDTGNALSQRLQGIEDALGKSLARSDEQLAYYVAQAREVIDLSLLSQQKIVEDLQRLAQQRGAEGSEA